MPLISGAYGGHTIDFRRFAARGMTLLGRVAAAREGAIDIAADLAESLAFGDASFATFLDLADAHVAQHGLDIPDDSGARAVLPDPPCVAEPLRHLDLGTDGIGAVIWATGYGLDFGWIDLPVLDARGEPVQIGGVTDVPGLYFLGLSMVVEPEFRLSWRVSATMRPSSPTTSPPAADFQPSPVPYRLSGKIPGDVNPFTSGLRRIMLPLNPGQFPGDEP